MTLMIILFVYTLIFIATALVGVAWVAFNAMLVKNFGIFGMCLVAAIHALGPILIIATIVE